MIGKVVWIAAAAIISIQAPPGRITPAGVVRAQAVVAVSYTHLRAHET